MTSLREVVELLRSAQIGAAVIETALAPAQALADAPPHLLLMGRFKAGKSSVVNSILGERDFSPTGLTPVTAIACHIAYGERGAVHYHFVDGGSQAATIEDFRRLVDQRQDSPETVALRRRIAHVEIRHPAEVLRELTLIDTPGLGSMRTEDDVTALRQVDLADTVFWVVDAESGGIAADELETMRRLAPRLPPSWLVVNKADAKTAGDRLAIFAAVRREVPDELRDVALYSAALVLGLADGEAWPAGMAGIEADLFEWVARDTHSKSPGPARERRRQRAVRMGANAALPLVVAEWRRVAADVQALHRYRGRLVVVQAEFVAAAESAYRDYEQAVREALNALGSKRYLWENTSAPGWRIRLLASVREAIEAAFLEWKGNVGEHEALATASILDPLARLASECCQRELTSFLARVQLEGKAAATSAGPRWLSLAAESDPLADSAVRKLNATDRVGLDVLAITNSMIGLLESWWRRCRDQADRVTPAERLIAELESTVIQDLEKRLDGLESIVSRLSEIARDAVPVTLPIICP